MVVVWGARNFKNLVDVHRELERVVLHMFYNW